MDSPPETQIDLLHPLASLEWRECSEMPLGMSDAQAVVLEDRIYVGGGDSSTYRISPAVLLIYDSHDDSWKMLDTPTVNYALTTYNSKLVLVGGRDPKNGTITNQLWALDEQWHWTQSLPPMTTGRSQASAVSVDHYLIVVGGRDQVGLLDVVEVYDGRYWSKAQSIPKASCSMKSCLFKGIWYLAGGEEQGTEIIYSCLSSLITTTSSETVRHISVWKKLANVPLEWSTPVIIGKQLATVGGFTYSSAIHVYSFSSNSWMYVGNLPIASHSTCTVTLSTEELLVVGGEKEWELLSSSFRGKIETTSFPDGYLTMSALDRLEAMAGISVYTQLAPKYLTMATTGLHLNLSTLKHLISENNPVERSKALFEAWLSGKSSVAPTWKRLLEKLDNIQMGKLAQEITCYFDKTLVTSPSASLISESKKEELEPDRSEIERKELQTKPDTRDVAIQIKLDCQEVAVQSSPDIQEVAVQSSPDIQEVAVQSSPDIQEVAGQSSLNIQEVAGQSSPNIQEVAGETQSEAANAEMTGYIRGVGVIGETKFTVTTEGGSFEWKGYGLRLHVPKDSLPAGMEECRVNIRASLFGQFQFPEDSELLSPVFWLTAPCKFIKPVTLEIQHCAFQEDDTTLSGLSFVSAKCSQRSLPYRFRQLDGGVFTTHSSYSSIELSHFSGFGITGRKRTPRSYCAHLYHTMTKMYEWRYYFILTQDLNAKNTVVREHYGHFAKKEATLRIKFGGSEITLNIPADGFVTKEGWRITPFSFPTISRKDADQFEPGQWIPECQLIVEWEKKDQKPAPLRHKVDLIGAKAPCNFFYLILNPPIEEDSMSGDDSVEIQTPTPDLKGLMTALYHKVAHKWKMIGVYLEISDLDSIETKHHGDSHLCLVEMLDTWLKIVDPPPTWTAIIEAVEFLGEEQLGRELKEKYILPME